MLDKLKAALDSTEIPFTEAGWETRPDGDYGVYTLDSSAGSVRADNRTRVIALEGTVDLFTRSGGQEKILLVSNAINSVDGLSWYLNSVQYEQDSRLMHTEWVFSYPVSLE